MEHTKKNRWGFTLVELIVVITILAIVWTIAFITFTDYTVSARNSVRVTDVSSLQRSVEVYYTQTSSLPDPTTPVEITHGVDAVWTQWTFWDRTILQVETISNPVLDPNTLQEYVYSVSDTGKYQIGWILEAEVASITNTAYANSWPTAIVKGDYEGAISWDWIEIFLAPSIILRDTSVTDLTDPSVNDKFVTDWSQNLPAWFPWSENGYEAYNVDTIYDCDSDLGPIYLVESVQNAVRWTSMASVSPYSEILEARTDVAKLAIFSEYLSSNSCVSAPTDWYSLPLWDMLMSADGSLWTTNCYSTNNGLICYWSDKRDHLWTESDTWVVNTTENIEPEDSTRYFPSWAKIGVNGVVHAVRTAIDDPIDNTWFIDSYTSCYLTGAWEVYCAWDNKARIINNTWTPDHFADPTKIEFAPTAWKIVDLKAWESFVCAIDENNKLYCFWEKMYDYNTSAQLFFDRTSNVVPEFTDYFTWDTVRKYAIWGKMICALISDTQVKCYWYEDWSILAWWSNITYSHSGLNGAANEQFWTYTYTFSDWIRDIKSMNYWIWVIGKPTRDGSWNITWNNDVHFIGILKDYSTIDANYALYSNPTTYPNGLLIENADNSSYVVDIVNSYNWVSYLTSTWKIYSFGRDLWNPRVNIAVNGSHLLHEANGQLTKLWTDWFWTFYKNLSSEEYYLHKPSKFTVLNTTMAWWYDFTDKWEFRR